MYKDHMQAFIFAPITFSPQYHQDYNPYCFQDIFTWLYLCLAPSLTPDVLNGSPLHHCPQVNISRSFLSITTLKTLLSGLSITGPYLSIQVWDPSLTPQKGNCQMFIRIFNVSSSHALAHYLFLSWYWSVPDIPVFLIY